MSPEELKALNEKYPTCSTCKSRGVRTHKVTNRKIVRAAIDPTKPHGVRIDKLMPYFVPIVYVPRVRAEGFYGLPLYEDIAGVQDELNARLADVGDNVNNAAHPIRWVRNYVGGSGEQVRLLADMLSSDFWNRLNGLGPVACQSPFNPVP